MKSLRLELLGGFCARDQAGKEIEIVGTKAMLLLAYLALRLGHAHPRERLMALFWGERGECQARSSLRQAIWALRTALSGLEPCPLIVHGQLVSLDPDAVDTDIARLTDLIGKRSVESLTQAFDDFKGELLEGMRVREPTFQAILRDEESRLKDLLLDACSRLLEEPNCIQVTEPIAELAKRLLEIEPLNESAHRALMRYYEQRGLLAAAVRQFTTCRERLQSELQINPSEATTALLETLCHASASTPSSGPGPEPLEPRLSDGDKPSIAVLPFHNLSGDPEQEYFSDGITEDIINALSKLHWFLVIARNSSFVYKGRATEVTQIGRELKVHYILDGSVRKSGNRVRIAARLVDAREGIQLWAQTFDRELIDIFQLQDDITKSVTAAIEPKLMAIEGLRSQKRSAADLGAWDLVMRALTHYGRMTTEDSEAAIRILRQAVETYPDYGPAHSLLAFALLVSGHVGWWIPKRGAYQYAAELAHKAAQLDPEDPWAYLALGYLAFTECQTDDAVREYQRAIDLNPNFAIAYGYLGWALVFDGRSEAAINYFREALRMSPHDPLKAFFYSGTGVAHYYAGRYDTAIEWARRAIGERPGFTAAQRILCASLAQAGRHEETSAAMKRLRKLQPGVSLNWIEKHVPYTDRAMPHFLEGMRKAGLT